MSGYVETIAGRIIFRNTEEFDSFCERYSALFTSDDRIVSIGRGVGTSKKQKDISRELRVVRIPRRQFTMDFSPWTDEEVQRADDYGFIITCTDGFLSGSYRTPDETVGVNLGEWAVQNDHPPEPEQDDFDSYERWSQKHDTWLGYIEDAYHEAHTDVLPDFSGTLRRDSWQTPLDNHREKESSIEELFE